MVTPLLCIVRYNSTRLASVRQPRQSPLACPALMTGNYSGVIGCQILDWVATDCLCLSEKVCRVNDMPELSKMINEAMTKKDIGINALSRAADQAGLSLSSSTISLYRRGSLPKSIPTKTLEAFAQLLDIPRNDLYEAAYGDASALEDAETRASLEDSIS